MQLVKSEPGARKSPKPTVTRSDLSMSELTEELRDLEQDGGFEITFTGTIDELASKPLEELDPTQRAALLYCKNRNK